MNCKQANRVMLADERMGQNPKTHSDLAHHLKSCAPCSMRFDALTRVFNTIRAEVNSYNPNPFFSARVWSALSEGHGERLGSYPPLRAVTLATIAAAGVVLGIAIGGFFGQLFFGSQAIPCEWTYLAEEYFPSQTYLNPYESEVSNE